MIRILVLSIVDPAVQLGGAWTVTRELLRILKEGPLSAEVTVVACPHYTGLALRARRFSSMARSLVSRLPAKVEFARSRAMLAQVRRLLAEQHADLILLNGGDLLWLLPHLPGGIKRVLIAHNIESQLFASQVALTIFSRPALQSLAKREFQRLRTYELEGLRQIGRAVFLSTADESYARDQCPGLASMTMPPIFWDAPTARTSLSKASFKTPPQTSEARQTQDGLDIGMLANFEWWPNQQGLGWFLKHVLPYAPPLTTLHLFGKGSESVAPAHARIIAHGFVSDLSEVWRTCDFMVCPVLSGGGVCVKVAEAIYRGVPVLATRMATRGLPLDPDPGIALFDQPEEWVHFLNHDAVGFARQTIPLSMATRFYSGTYAKALSAFLSPE